MAYASRLVKTPYLGDEGMSESEETERRAEGAARGIQEPGSENPGVCGWGWL